MGITASRAVGAATRRGLLLAAATITAAAHAEPSHVTVRCQIDGQPQTLTGEVFAEDQQGGVCLLADDGRLTIVQPAEVIERTELDAPFAPASHKEVARRLSAELGEQFDCYVTPHYVVAYSTSREYARWLSSLLERLHKAFVSYWRKQGVELTEPRFPLVVVVHQDAAAYRRASADELGGASGIIGYYSMTTNRVSMYDLTGAESRRASAGGRTTMRDINRMVARPSVSPLVATVVHEATHQVAFNVGLMRRFADLPLWFVEGMAIYFEAPDLSSGRGWRGIGKVNYPRLRQFRGSIRDWDADRLAALVADDGRLRQAETALDAYAEAWALTYFLIKQRPEEYRSYLDQQGKLLPFQEQPPGGRAESFEEHFGPAAELNQDFLRAMLRVN